MTVFAYQSAADVATDLIRTRINETPLPPGTRINPAELAAEFGISRTPIRDALARLQTEGLVDVVPRVGIFVRTISKDEVLEIYAVKEALEPIMVQMAVERCSAERRSEWAAGAARLSATFEVDSSAYLDIVVERRQELIDMSGGIVLGEVFRIIDGRVRALRARNLGSPTRRRASVREHLAIAKAVAAGDGPLAFTLSKKHVQSARRSLIRLIDQQEKDASTRAS